MKKREEIERAVALKYKEFPTIVAKGGGELARRIIEIAELYGIPIYEDPDLIEILSHLDVGEEIPPELYEVIAEVLAFLYILNDQFGNDS
jgi:flagellar biosynthesis protein